MERLLGINDGNEGKSGSFLSVAALSLLILLGMHNIAKADCVTSKLSASEYMANNNLNVLDSVETEDAKLIYTDKEELLVIFKNTKCMFTDSNYILKNDETLTKLGYQGKKYEKLLGIIGIKRYLYFTK